MPTQLDPSRIRRIFLLGPSHHVYLPGCAVTAHATYATPIGDITIDRDTTKMLHDTGAFDVMDESTDEDEHSVEMHLPYIAHVMKGRDFVLVPILVGALSPMRAAEYGQRLAPYLEDPETAFVISSDFCHWGKRFRYTHVAPGHRAIHEGIEALDREGMALIEAQEPAAFEGYLKRTENTICGRNPISVLLHVC
jgi:AmmeMemoRadiSam system protein B